MSPINRSINDLPEGWAPDKDVRFAHLLAERWRDESIKERAEHVPSGKRFRASDGGKCARYLSYRAAGIAETDPMDLTGHWNTRLGRILHDAWQGVMQDIYPHAEIEVAVDFDPDGTVRIDLVIRQADLGWITAIELKSIGGYGFKSAIGKAKRGTPAEGPRVEHVVQAALGGKAVDADEIVVAYLAKEAISQSFGMREIDRFCAEWTLPREKYLPIAESELKRASHILALLDDEKKLAARKIPGVPGEIVSPGTGRWQVTEWDVEDNTKFEVVDTGTTWHCGYCSHHSLCRETASGRIPLETVVELRARLDHDPLLNPDVTAAEEATWD